MEKRTELSKALKPHWVVAIAFGSAIGWGAFVLPTDWMAAAGPIGVILGILIGALLVMVIAVSYGYMVEKFPVSGGEFVFTYLGFGRINAFICGWFVTLSYVTSVALNASAIIVLFKFLYPQIVEIGYMYTIAGWDVYVSQIIIAAIALIVFGIANIRGISLTGRMQFIFSAILFSGAMIVGLGMTFHPDTAFSNLRPAFNMEIGSLSSILIIVATAPFLYSGFNNIAQASEEFSFSSKRAFKLMILALGAGGLVYSIMVYATAMATPWQGLVAGQPVWGTGDVVKSLFGNVGMTLLTAALCMGIFTGINGFLVSSSRMLLAMGRARILPQAFTKIHPKYHTPYIGIITAVVVCFITPWFGRPALLWIVDMTATGVAIAYLYTCASAYRFFDWKDSAARKLTSLAGALISLVFLGLLFIPGSPAFLAMPSLIAMVVWVLIGVIFYAMYGKRYNAIPKEELDVFILGDELSKTLTNDSFHRMKQENERLGLQKSVQNNI
ncbi:amino acid permease [Sporosarcina sp. P37]|uniref:APC family permease n=1 Tax=unclassified Sporosarcina TaxID=2647733 RepID=UPI0009C0612A|nr:MULTISPECIES: APC family permease [unclassified Sporosarcina]ARK24810.1 amino acid permease [Sporosarcina sp. P37]PID19969.1 APC family permease [Sporosarcina sp. P35]